MSVLMRAAIFICTLLLSSTSQGKTRYFSFYTQYNIYSDIVKRPGSDMAELPADVSMNLDIRLFRIVNFILHAGQSFDGIRTYSGAGLRLDLPGFFMLGGTTRDLVHRSKRRGVNTSVYWKVHIVEIKGAAQPLVGNKMGFAADTFLSKSLFLTFDLGLYSDDGNQFISPSAGIGYEF